MSQLIDALLNFDFMRYSLISGILIGFIAPLIGAFIVVRRLSLIADALSHVTLGGISFGMFLLTIMPTLVFINPMWFGILFAIVGALLIEKLRTSYTAYQEIAIPIIMSAGIALSAIFISLADGFNQEIVGLLFGSISAVNISDLTTIIVIAIIVVLFITLFYKELFILSFDEEYSKVIGIPKWIQFLFIVIVAMVISASMRVVGILLVSALITLPIAISMRITKSFKQLILLSVFLGELSVILGLVLAFYMDISPGGVIVVLLVILLMITMAYQKMRMKFKKELISMNTNDAIKILKENGLKYTDKRKDMLDIFVEEDKYINAKYIQQVMDENYPGISFDTIYRNLHLFKDLGIIENTELDGEMKFRIACTNHHHHHFIQKSVEIQR